MYVVADGIVKDHDFSLLNHSTVMYLASAFLHSGRTERRRRRSKKKKRIRKSIDISKKGQAKPYKFCLETSELCNIHIAPCFDDEYIEDEDLAQSESDCQVFQLKRSRNSYDEDLDESEQKEDELLAKNDYSDNDSNVCSEHSQSQTQTEGRERSSKEQLNAISTSIDMEQLKEKYMALQQQNESLIEQLKQFEITAPITRSVHNGSASLSTVGFDDCDAVYQLIDDFKCLREEINFDASAKSEYKKCKLRMEAMCEPLNDLALDFESEILQNALDTIRDSVDKIGEYEMQKMFQHGLLMDIMQECMDKIEKINMRTRRYTDEFILLSSQSMNMHSQFETTKEFPEFSMDETDDGHLQLSETETESSDTCKDDIEFDACFPLVKRIEIVGNWFNKKPRAIIEWNGVEFGRKLSDFKWFWRMLSLNSSIDRVVPDYPSDIPESLWPDGYLRRRKRELNLFLMQCHSLPWIKKYKLYNSVFLETNKKKWKQKRNEFDQMMMKRIKNNQATYDEE